MLRYVLLALLRDGQPAHGYALMKAYAERSGVRLSIGNVYRELQRLVGQGLIATATNPEGADPRRAPYSITDAGSEALTVWLAAPARLIARPTPDELTQRLAVVGDMDPEQAARFLDDLHDELWERAKSLERERAFASGQRERDEGRTNLTRGILLDRRARHLAADIEVVDEIRSRLAAVHKRAGAKSTPAVGVSERKPIRTLKKSR